MILCEIVYARHRKVTPSRSLFLPVLVQRRTQQQEQLSIRYKEMIRCQTLPGGEQVWLAMLAR